jgi:hypothetical protein
MKKVNNYARFFALIKSLPGDQEEIKENLVKAFTNGRTMSLREMTPDEYHRICDSLPGNKPVGLSQKDFTAEIKRKRSAVLNRLQKLGIDTSDRSWAPVDNFCLNPRIAGKRFAQLSLDDLKKLIPKLEALLRKPTPASPTPEVEVNDVTLSYGMFAGSARSQIIN